MMTQIRVTEDTHGKIMDRKNRTLTSAELVVANMLELVNNPNTTPVATSNEPCKQCEEYKKQLEESNKMGRIIQTKHNDRAVEVKTLQDEENKLRKRVEELDEENEKLMEDLNAANDEIERLDGKQVLPDDPEYTETPTV